MSIKSWGKLLALTGAALAVIVCGPWLLLTLGEQAPEGNRWQAESNARTALVQLVVGIGVLAGAVYAARTFGITRRNQQNERFAKAVENLGAKEARIRSGGVHTLQMLAQEQGVFWDPVDDLLSTLVRERLDTRNGAETTGFRDVQTALTALGTRRRDKGSPIPRPLDLSGLDLSGFVLDRVNFHRANLTKATLENVRAIDAVLTEAVLIETTADEADFSGADFRDANGSRAVWGTAKLFNATVDDFTVDGADLGLVRAMTVEQIVKLSGTAAVAPIASVL